MWARLSFFGLSQARSCTFAAFPFLLFGPAVHPKKHILAKPIKNNMKIKDFGRFRVGLWCSRGPPWRPLGPPGAAQRAAKEALGGSICVSDGLLGASGSHFGPPWVAAATADGPLGVFLVPFRTHFGAFSVFRFVFARSEQKQLKKRNIKIKQQNKL